DAPPDEVTLELKKPGYIYLTGQRLRLEGQESVITMNPFVQVKGVVTDAVTGRPIEEFDVTPGHVQDDGHHVIWQPTRTQRLKRVPYFVSFESPAAGYQIRVEADGYATFVSKTFQPGTPQQRLDVALTRDAPTVLSVRTPDGEPAAHAQVGLCS